MTFAEAIETTRIHGVPGFTGGRTTMVTTHPFRALHHTISESWADRRGCSYAWARCRGHTNAAFRGRSTIFHVERMKAPMLLLHGAQDEHVLVRQAVVKPCWRLAEGLAMQHSWYHTPTNLITRCGRISHEGRLSLSNRFDR